MSRVNDDDLTICDVCVIPDFALTVTVTCGRSPPTSMRPSFANDSYAISTSASWRRCARVRVSPSHGFGIAASRAFDNASPPSASRSPLRIHMPPDVGDNSTRLASSCSFSSVGSPSASSQCDTHTATVLRNFANDSVCANHNSISASRTRDGRRAFVSTPATTLTCDTPIVPASIASDHPGSFAYTSACAMRCSPSLDRALVLWASHSEMLRYPSSRIVGDSAKRIDNTCA